MAQINISTPESQIKDFLQKAAAFQEQRVADSSKYYAKKGLELAKKYQQKDKIIQGLGILCAVAYNLERNLEAADSLNQMLIKAIKEPKLLSNKYLNSAAIKHARGDMNAMGNALEAIDLQINRLDTVFLVRYHLLKSLYEHSAFRYLEALASNKKAQLLTQDSSPHWLTLNNNLALLYSDLGLKEQALTIYQDLLKRSTKRNNYNNIIYNMYGIAQCHFALKDYSEAKKYCYQAINKSKEIGYGPVIGLMYYKLGSIYEQELKIDSAIYQYKSGIDVSLEQKELAIMNNNKVALSSLFLNQGNLQEAKKYALEADQFVPLADFDVAIELNEILANIAKTEKNFERAYQYLYKTKELRDQVSKDSIQKSLIVELLEERHEKEKQLAEMEYTQQLQRQQLISWGTGFGSILFFFSGLFLLWAYRQTKQKNQLLVQDLANKHLIEQQAQQLQKTDALKTRLFANLSHELRTPLTLIISPIKHILNQHDLSKDVKNVLNKALHNSQHLVTMTNQIITLTKAELADIPISINTFSLQNLIAHITAHFQPLADSKDIQLIVQDNTNLATKLITDARLLETIISNLLTNAFKYTSSRGQIKLLLEEETGYIQLLVEDNGKGISEEDLPYIFDRFYQSTSGVIKAEGGTGIGLSICKEYIRLVGGTIKVESQINQGSQFTITFPIIHASLDKTIVPKPIEFYVNTPEISNDAIEEEEEYLLIVEDNIELSQYLQSVLEEDYHVVISHNGQAALQQIEKKVPRLILTDLIMPEMDGYEMITAIRANPQYNLIRILVLTAKESVIDELNAFRYGADEFLLKPFDEVELKIHINNLLNRQESQEEAIALQRKAYTFDSEQNKKNQIWLKKVESLILSKLEEVTLDIEELCQSLSISPAQFNRKMKQLTGLTPKKYITELRLLTARRMLLQEEVVSVKTVALSVGFRSDKVFSRNFKARFGKNPSMYIMGD